MNKRVLVIAHHRLNRSPGQRFRFEQYLAYLERNGYRFEISNIVEEEDDGVLYGKGKYLPKFLLALKAWFKRYRDTRRANQFDIIFIFREAFFTGTDRFERAFSKSKAKLIFDFDDAIWLPNVSINNRKLSLLKKPSKTQKLIAYADMIFAGNEYLAEYARKYNDQVKVIPTTINTNYHSPRPAESERQTITIGWTGSQTTLQYLELIQNVLKRLKTDYGRSIQFKVICDEPWNPEGLEIENVKWNRKEEIDQLQSIDIGLMPLSDDEWSKGKCAFKALQYMAIGIPAVISPVGVNREIIEEGVNGFTAVQEEDWFQTLSNLINNAQLRKDVGSNARKFVIENYSVEAHKKRYLTYFEEVLAL